MEKESKKKLFIGLIISLVVIALLIGLFFLWKSCKEQEPVEEKSSNAYAFSAGELVFKDGIANLTFSNDTETYDFNNVITVSEGATWVLASDENGTNVITNLNLSLNLGDNTFYIIVTAEDEVTIKSYTVIIRRRPIYTVSFETIGTPVDSLEVEEGTKVKLNQTTSKENYTFNGWYLDNTKYNSYTVTSDVTFTAKFTLNTLYFGTYPQSLVEANEENGLSSIEFDELTWTDYGYYSNGSVCSYMYYLDVDVDDDGANDYRGVYFTQYRPYINSYSPYAYQSNQDDNGYFISTIYWFKYEPIKWNVISQNGDKVFVISEIGLDSQAYYNDTNPRVSATDYQGNSTVFPISPNNYKYSYIREWLNTTFYETAFNESEKAKILTTDVNNGPSANGEKENTYACENTNDKIFLPSKKEAKASKIFTNLSPSDYALCQGAEYYPNGSSGYILARYPASENSSYYVLLYSTSSQGWIGVNYTDYAVHPACWINIE